MSNPSIQVDLLIRELRFLPFAHKKLFAERPAEQLLHQWPLYTIFALCICSWSAFSNGHADSRSIKPPSFCPSRKSMKYGGYSAFALIAAHNRGHLWQAERASG